MNISAETANPDVIYMVLVLSLWVSVTAAYIPGTGIMEGVAVVGLFGSLVALAQLPTNWIAVLGVVVGVAMFFVMPFLKQQYAPMAVLGLGLQGLGGVFLFNDLTVSPFVIMLMLVIPLAYHQLVLLPMIQKINDQPVTHRDDTLIGMHGRVTEDINRVGTVRVNSELWTATSDDPLEAGSEIIVVAREGLQLVVEEMKRKRHSETSETPEENG